MRLLTIAVALSVAMVAARATTGTQDSIPAVHMDRRGSRYMIPLPNCPEARGDACAALYVRTR